MYIFFIFQVSLIDARVNVLRTLSWTLRNGVEGAKDCNILIASIKEINLEERNSCRGGILQPGEGWVSVNALAGYES